MKKFLLCQLLCAVIGWAEELRKKYVTGNDLDPDLDMWWIDTDNLLSYPSLIQLQTQDCDSDKSVESRFRYYNNAGQVYVHMTTSWIFMEFWYPYDFWSGYATTAQMFGNGKVNDECYQCIEKAGFANPQEYDFSKERILSSNYNCWSACLENNNTFLSSGEKEKITVAMGDDKPSFFEARIMNDLSVNEQDPTKYRISKNDMDFKLTQTFNRSLEVVLVSKAHVYNWVDGSLIFLGPDAKVPYIHGCWFRRYSNNKPNGNVNVNENVNGWLSPFNYNYQNDLKNSFCFTWIASTSGADGNVDKMGVVCPTITKCHEEKKKR